MQLKNIVRVEIALENCEGVTIPMEDVRYISATDITESLRSNNILMNSEELISYYRHAGYFRIIVKDKPEYERLTEWNDIAQVHLYDDEENHDWFFVHWGADDYDNSAHQSLRRHRGELDITVTKEANE